MTGHFTSHYLAEILRDVFLQEKCGSLRLDASTGPRIALCFDRGMLTDAETPSGAATLAAALRDDGVVGAEALLDAVQDCTTAAELSQTLVKRRAVTRQGLEAGLKGLIRRALTEAFSWQGGTFELEEGKTSSNSFNPDVLFTFESILNGIDSMANFEPLREVLTSIPGRLKLSTNMFLPVHRLALKPHHGFVLSRIDGSMSLAELAQVIPGDSVDAALKFVYGLLVFGVVRIDPAPCQGSFQLREIIPTHHETRARIQREERFIRDSLGRMAGQSASEILGVGEGDSKETLRAAFEDRRAQFRRERFCEAARDSMKKDLDLIEARVTEAFFNLELRALENEHRLARSEGGVITVSEDELIKRREFSKTEKQATREENTKLSERYYAKAREYFREADYHNCIQFCKLAIKFNAESAPVYHLMADSLVRNPDRRWQRQAEEAYVKATELDAFNVEYFVSLGVFYKERGMDMRARKMLEKALEILPSHAVANRELKSLRR
jgi:tetratricopeptide (TPR) repeat protein